MLQFAAAAVRRGVVSVGCEVSAKWEKQMRKLGIIATLVAASVTLSACVVVPVRPRPYGYYAPAPAVVVARPAPRYYY